MSLPSSLLLIFGIIMILCQLSFCQNWQSFRKKHIGCPNSCNKELRKSIFSCRPANDFICASETTVKNLCRGTKDNQNKLSSTEFKLISCRPTRKRCKFSQRSLKAKICVTCRNKEPVHFKGYGRC